MGGQVRIHEEESVRNLVRLVAATALSLPVVVGAAGLASAESAGYHGDHVGVGPLGFHVDYTDAHSGDGEAFYHNEHLYAGDLGFHYHHIASFADDGSDHHDDGAEAGHAHESVDVHPLGFAYDSGASYAEND
ncbi:hypothetical protein GCM10010492_10790 [Saccharothrix mutabilis subsp. mutabilis]|uniref:Uncharacterized protein n=1 Tax=Saccharothrix mutabilis subsp. mutabilis TaxID=66855 RepID=A0ABP3CT58_9PSEU